MSRTNSLPCWIIDTPVDQMFPIDDNMLLRWGNVKDEIKKKASPDFDDMPARTLDLWKVTIDCSQIESLLGSKDYLKNVTTTKPLHPRNLLSTEFKDPLPVGHVDIIIVRRRPATISPSSSEDSNLFADNTLKRPHPDFHHTDGARRKRLRELPRLSERYLRKMKKLYEQIHMLPEELKKYSDPNEVFDLPFPSVNKIPPRFSLLNEGMFSYMGRACFDQVFEAFSLVQKNSRQRQSVSIYGGKGFGKSYILAALACLLVRTGTQVVYIPDVHACLLEPRSYLLNAVAFAFVNSEPSLRKEILDCEDLESLANFCAWYQEFGQLCFIVDQLNALDPEPMGHDVVSNAAKESLRRLLTRMSANHILITSASANHKSFRHMAETEFGEQQVPLMGGMTSSEMSFWWKHHDFSNFSDADTKRVEDLTGCIPLLLKPFVMHHEKTLEALEPQIWEDPVLESVRKQIFDFANAKKIELYYHTADKFVDLMRNSLMGVRIAGYESFMDHPYFYIDAEGNGRYSCGLAKQAITEFLRINTEESSIFLGAEWYESLMAFKNNPSAIAFTVEQIVISKIACTGLHLGDFHLPAAQTFAFNTLTVRLSIDKPHTYYVPVRFHLKVIDLLFASIDPEKKTAHIVPIQITVAKEHKDSETAFFAEQDTWLCGLEDFEVKKSFVWIHHGNRGRKEVKKKLKALRDKTIEVNPDYEVHWVSIEQIDVQLDKALRKIRRMS